MPAKQVLVMKKFPKDRNMRTGKYCAQASHASLGAIFSLGKIDNKNFIIPMDNPFVYEWITSNFKKVTCYVETDQELVEIYNQAKRSEIATALIKDAGLTEFKEIATLTAVGVGPDDEEKINKITGHLPLF